MMENACLKTPNMPEASYTAFLAELVQADLILTPTRRLATRLNKDFAHYQKKQGQSTWQVDIIALSGWLERLWQALEDDPLSVCPLRLNPWQDRLIWQSIIDTSETRSPLLRTQQAAKLAQQAWALLKQWRLDWRSLQALPLANDQQIFLTWCEAYDARCEDENWCDNTTLVDRLIDALPLPKLKKCILVGFTDITPQINALLDKLAAQGTDIVQRDHQSDGAQVAYLPCQDQNHELAQAAHWAKAQLAQNPVAPIAVVIPDLAKQWQTVEATFASVLMPQSQLAQHYQESRPFNISSGQALAQFPMVRLAFQLLRFNSAQAERETLSQLLLSPFISGGQSERAARALLDAQLRDTQQAQWHVEQILPLSASQACPMFCQLLSAQTEQHAGGLRLASQWCEYIKTCLAQWGWPGERVLSSLEYQVLQRFYTHLNTLATLDTVLEPISYSKACSLLLAYLQQELFQGESEDKPIQVLGTLEAAGQHFSALWVSGLHNEAWPGPAKPHPLLPVMLQRQQAMPHASSEREMRFAEDLTARFSQQARQVIFSYPQQAQDKQLSPSAFISGYPKSTAQYSPPSEARSVLDNITLENWAEHTQALGPGPVKVTGGASLLQAQAACPFQAYARYRLKVKPLGQTQRGLSHLQRGLLVHAALEFFWQAMDNSQQLNTLPDAAYQQAIERAVEQAIAQQLPAEKDSALAGIEKQRLNSLLERWLSLEKQREYFKVIGTETVQSVQLGDLALSLRIDRIDQMANGDNIVIDYKTGQVATPDWFDERPTQVQLPLYAIAQPQVQAVAFAQVQAKKCKFTGLAAEDEMLPSVTSSEHMQWSDMQQHWQRILNEIAGEFYQGVADVNPKAGGQTCRTCEFALMCRIRSQA